MRSSIYGEGIVALLLLLFLTLPAHAEKHREQSAKPLPIVLTFDDGPHALNSPYHNDTRMVLRALENNPVQPHIVGAFFVQTYTGRMGNGTTSPGSIVVRDAYRAGNVIAIHTGSRADHVRHTLRVRQPAEDVDGNGMIDERDGANGLASDLIRAKRRLSAITGEPTHYVRPVQGAVDSKVLATYAKQGLAYIRWNVDSCDNHPPRPAPEKVRAYLRSGVVAALRSPRRTALIVLFHDINNKTALHLSEYIATIDQAVRRAGRVPEFTTSREAIEKALRENAEPLRVETGKKSYERRRKQRTTP